MSDDYERKRDFEKTPEPPGKGAMGSGKAPMFVVQEHDASTHHFDFRLEVDGALKSWAVPKGPSTDPREKRLAVPTEDHPLEYGDFEGVIPKGEYGGGTVSIWDRGTFENVTEKGGEAVDASTALARGHLLFRLRGEKLKGGYALQRTGNDEGANWLLIKMRDDDADARRKPVTSQPKSVKSRRTIAQIAKREQEGDDA